MKKLIDLRLKPWFEEKQSDAFVSAGANAAYTFEVIKETEKAIQISIYKRGKEMDWKMWFPKSVVTNLEEVMEAK